jgi:DNA-binding NarL/FixJ family response regulator
MEICIADSQTRVRYGLRKLLEQQAGWNVVREAASANELIEHVRCDHPDVVLIDWELPGMPIEALLKTLREACSELLVISLSGRSELRQAALEAGADAFASKAEPPDRLIQLIGQLMKSESEIYYEKRK